MGTVTREQLINYIKGLEQKVKDYQSKVKERDDEINILRHRLVKVTGDDDVINKVMFSMEQEAEQEEKRSAENETCSCQNTCSTCCSPLARLLNLWKKNPPLLLRSLLWVWMQQYGGLRKIRKLPLRRSWQKLFRRNSLR